MLIKVNLSSQQTLKMFKWLVDKDIKHEIILQINGNPDKIFRHHALERFLQQCEWDDKDNNTWSFGVKIKNKDDAMMFKLVWG